MRAPAQSFEALLASAVAATAAEVPAQPIYLLGKACPHSQLFVLKFFRPLQPMNNGLLK